jgi:RNA polymerase-binding transcription factor DksA
MQKKPTKATPKKSTPPPAPAKPAAKATKKSASASASASNSAAPQKAESKASAAQIAAAALPPPKTKFTKDELRHFKAQLLELRERLTRQVGAMEGQAFKEGDSEVSVDHMADHGTDTFDQDFTLGLIENEENTIREIDAAIDRVSGGAFGVCEPCIEDPAKLCKTCPHIPKARIEAIPYTRYCVEYARIAERDREIEEANEKDEE